ncbi:response regulator transcription factor [Oceanobacillus halotolerans]|uniref:response regulator transcription factor n=1 Tax=Oceanobacillus halotolerans TaxID=2663380 RepID=UPI0013DC39C3|nr:response regulator transcription factor [Oceanobacillus halotolerans]
MDKISIIQHDNHSVSVDNQCQAKATINHIPYNDDIATRIEELNPDFIVFVPDELDQRNAIFKVDYIKQQHPRIPVIILSHTFETIDVLAYIRVGVSGFIDDMTDLSNTICVLKRGHYVLPNDWTEDFLLEVLHLKQRNKYTFSQLLHEHGIHLTKRETDVAYLLKQNKSNTEIGKKLDLRVGAVKVHVSHIYSKLNIKKRSEAVSFLNRIGMLRLGA